MTTSALTVTEKPSAPLPFEPENMSQMFRFADFISRATTVPRALQGKPADILLVLMKGRDLGFNLVQSLSAIHIVEGKAALDSSYMVALCKKSPVCEYFRLVESTDKRATYETKRRGELEPTRMTFTWEQAERAGVTGKDNWRKWPDAMLRARCASALARAVYPDAVAGLYESDEVEAPPPPRPAHQRVVEQASTVRLEPADFLDAAPDVPADEEPRPNSPDDLGYVSPSPAPEPEPAPVKSEAVKPAEVAPPPPSSPPAGAAFGALGPTAQLEQLRNAGAARVDLLRTLSRDEQAKFLRVLMETSRDQAELGQLAKDLDTLFPRDDEDATFIRAEFRGILGKATARLARR